MIFFAVVLLVLAGDQISKLMVRRYLPLDQSKPIIKGIISFTHIKNSGAAFGILPNKQWLFLIIAIVAIAAAVLFILNNKEKGGLTQLALGLAVGGALGNLMDRFLFGNVTDFIDFHFWPVFNFADTSIFVGMFLLIIIIMREPGSLNELEKTDK
ncbi:MAG TPA: signal peptidase II [Actinobacteria bacterium]|nr:signal peptidase II [Actinomycetes bacterium]HEX21301.1 signal peptidase II [Actinomycetota bacterium]